MPETNDSAIHSGNEFVDAEPEIATGTMNPQGAGGGVPQLTLEQLQSLLHAAQDRRPKEMLPKLAEYDGDRKNWQDWKLKAENKLACDGEALGNDLQRLMYVHSRLTGKAAEMTRIFVKMRRDNNTGNAQELLEYMEKIYGDPDKVRRAVAELSRLRQKEGESFAEFLPKFETLLAEGGGTEFPSVVQINYLQNAINKEMKKALVTADMPDDYANFSAKLQDIGSKLNQFDPYKPRKSGPNDGPPLGEPMDWEPVRSSKGRQWVNNCGCKGNNHTCGRKQAKWVTQEAIAYRRNNQLCLRCGNAGHIVKDCRFLPAKRPGPTPSAGTAPPARANKAELEEGYRRKAMAEEIETDEEKGGKSLALDRSRGRGPEGTKPLVSKADRTETRKQWEAFKPKMEGPLFYAETLVNDAYFVKALIDSGSGSYALMSEKYAREIKLDTIPIEPRPIEGVVAGMDGEIREVARIDMDIGGYRMKRVFAYILPGQTDDLILGRPWMKHEFVEVDERAETLRFALNGVTVGNTRRGKTKAATLRINHVLSSTFTAIAKREKKRKEGVQIFAASMADIEKALKPKHKPTRVEIERVLPAQYRRFVDLFDPEKADELPPHRPGIDHRIQLEKDENGKEKEVPWGALYNMSRDELLLLRKNLTELLDKNFIRLSKSPAGAPVLFARKPGGGLRFCVDYRGLNAITKKDRYPIPLIRETMTAMSKAKWLTKLDVSAAFHKIRVQKGDEWKTAFRTRYGLYEWLVTPFGLTGAPATFQRYINWTLREYLDDFCTAYIDDILIYSSGTREDHSAKVGRVLEKLRAAGLQLDLSKCEFEARKIKYLGYIIEVGKGISMDPEKVEAIRSWTTPRTVKGVRSFLGFANYYRIFIKEFAIIAEPLTRLTKKGAAFEWTQQCEEAFRALKEAFVNGPILAIYDPERETRLEPDASGWATGGVLAQYDEDKKAWRPIAFMSTKHTPAECNYDIHDKELLAIMKCVAAWGAELKGLTKTFVILTDHRNLEPFMTKKKLSERQVRWSQTLAPFDFRIEHRPGTLARAPDALSRREQDLPQDVGDDRVAERERVLLPESSWKRVTVNCNQMGEAPTAAETPFKDGNLARLWKEAMESSAGKSLEDARKAVRDGARKFPTNLKAPVATGDCDECDGYLRYRGRLWIPSFEPLTTALIQETHDSVISGHPGRDATMALMTRQFFWPGMSQDVRRFVRNCDVCGRTTIWRTKKQGLLRPLPVPDRVWQEISVDYMVDLPESDGCEQLLVITDRLGKGTMLIPIPQGKFDALGFAELFIERYVSQHWLPRGIVSDRGVQWVNAFWKKVCELLGIERRLSTAYHPETDGATERRNQEVQTYLRAFIAYNQKDWKRWLPTAQIALDGKPSTTTGISPFFMTHGYDVRAIETNPSLDDDGRRNVNPNPAQQGEAMVAKMKEACEWAQAAMAAAQQIQQDYANRGREAPITYKVGDKVWLHLKNFATDRPCKKLDWLHAKYTVTKVFPNKHVYELDVPGGVYKRFHTTLLRPASTDALPSQTNDDPQPPAIRVNDEDEYLVEDILCARWEKRGRGKRRMALIKWKGFAKPTWEPAAELDETAAMDTYEERYGPIAENDGPLEDYTREANERRGRRQRARRGAIADDSGIDLNDGTDDEIGKEEGPTDEEGGDVTGCTRFAPQASCGCVANALRQCGPDD